MRMWKPGWPQPHHTTAQPFYGPFPGPPGCASAGKELLDFMVQGKINRGRHTDHPAGRHSIRTNQCPPPPSPHIFYRADALPAAQPTVSKHCKPEFWQKKIKHFSRTFIHFPDLFQQCFYHVREYLWHHSYVAVKSLVSCKLLYIVQSIELEIFTRIHTNVTFNDGYYGLCSSSINLLSIKFSHRGHDDYEVLKPKHCQGPLTSNSKTLRVKALFCFYTLSMAGK